MHSILKSLSFKLAIIMAATLPFLHGVPASAAITTGTLVKSPSFSAVYYVGADSKRYVFFNAKVYASWYQNFTTVQTVTDSELASLRLGGNVTYRPGVRMIKIQSDPKVYAVARNGTLRYISSETVAAALYGPTWNQFIDDVDVTEFVNYRIGLPVNVPGDFNAVLETAQAVSINVDKGLLAGDPASGPAPVPTSGRL